jgi:16S rRNA (guanine527-N7)-methyltransferase
VTEKIINAFEKSNLVISEQVAKQLEEFMLLVLHTNKTTNLTTITDTDEFVTKHLVDSAVGGSFLLDNSTVLDLGSGAGFPALVLKILNPSLKFVLVDSVRKKVDFLNNTIKQLSLSEVVAIHERAEDYAKNNRESFDFVTSRAVANMSTLLEYSLPFLRIGGKMIVYKGPNVNQELENSKNSLKILGGKVQSIIQLNIEENARNIVVIEKVSSSPKQYPRDKNLPRKNPLN